MAKSSKNKSSTSRHGKVPVGWAKQNVQIPEHIAEEVKQQAEIQGYGSVKILSTAAFSFLLALPQDDLDTICNYVHQITWNDPSRLDKNHIRELIRMLLNGESVVDESQLIQKRIESAANKAKK